MKNKKILISTALIVGFAVLSALVVTNTSLLQGRVQDQFDGSFTQRDPSTSTDKDSSIQQQQADLSDIADRADPSDSIASDLPVRSAEQSAEFSNQQLDAAIKEYELAKEHSESAVDYHANGDGKSAEADIEIAEEAANEASRYATLGESYSRDAKEAVMNDQEAADEAKEIFDAKMQQADIVLAAINILDPDDGSDGGLDIARNRVGAAKRAIEEIEADMLNASFAQDSSNNNGLAVDNEGNYICDAHTTQPNKKQECDDLLAQHAEATRDLNEAEDNLADVEGQFDTHFRNWQELIAEATQLELEYEDLQDIADESKAYSDQAKEDADEARDIANEAREAVDAAKVIINTEEPDDGIQERELEIPVEEEEPEEVLITPEDEEEELPAPREEKFKHEDDSTPEDSDEEPIEEEVVEEIVEEVVEEEVIEETVDTIEDSSPETTTISFEDTSTDTPPTQSEPVDEEVIPTLYAETESTPTSQNSNPFNDIRGHWAENYIAQLYDDGVVSGKNANQFSPDTSITRAEALKIILSGAGYDESEANGKTESYNDVSSNDWFYKWIVIAENEGFIRNEGGNYRPNANINRADFTVLLARTANQTLYGYTQDDIRFNDVRSDTYFAYAVLIASDTAVSVPGEGTKTLIGGYQDGSFKPANPISRAEAAALMLRAKLAWF